MNENVCVNCDFHSQLYIYDTPTDYHICHLKGAEPINPQGTCEKYEPKTELLGYNINRPDWRNEE